MKNSVTQKTTFAVMGYCFIAYFSTAVNPIIQKMIEAYPKVSTETIRMISTLPALSTFFSAIVVGLIVGKKIKFRTVCVLSCLFWSIGGLMPIILNQKFVYILIARLIFGIGTGCALCYNALVINTYDESNRAKMLGMALFMVNAGSIFVQLLGGYLGEIKWQYTFYIYFICPIALILVMFFLKEPKYIDNEEKMEIQYNINKKGIVKVGVFFFVALLAGIAIYPISSGISTFITENNLGDSSISGVVLSLYTLGGAIAGGMLDITKKMRRFAVPYVFAISGIGFVLIFVGNSIFIVSIGAVLCGIGYFSVKPLFTIVLSHEFSNESMTIVSTLLLAGANLGIFLSNYWINIADVALKGVSGSEIERSFLAGLIVYAVIAVIFSIIDVRSKAMIEVTKSKISTDRVET